jgi:hypothetical protein
MSNTPDLPGAEAHPPARGALRRVISLGQPWTHGGGLLDRAVARFRRPVDRGFLRHYGRLGDLPRLLRAPRVPEGRPRVLVVSLRAWPAHAAYETVIAHALRLRGCETALVTCGGGQPACEMGWGRQALPRPCDRCAWFTNRVLGMADLPSYRLADMLPWGGNARQAPSEPDERPDPDATRISVPWFLRTSQPDTMSEGPAARADFEVAADGIRHAANAILDDFRPDVVFLVNGLFTSEHVFSAAARERGLRVVTYERAGRGQTLFFSEDAPAPTYYMDTAWNLGRDRPLTPRQNEVLDELLLGRSEGRGAHERYFDETVEDRDRIEARLGIERGERVLSLFANLTWDSACLDRDIAYDSMVDWITRVVASARDMRGTRVVVRAHPSEARRGTREPILPLVSARLGGDIPANVSFVPGHEPLSSYVLLAMSDLVMVYTSTVGIEAAVRGHPVAVAGDAHYRGRGFTIDLDSHERMERAMAGDDAAITPEQIELARRYAFTFFFRKMIPFPIVRVDGERIAELAPSVDSLRPGAEPFLDLICEQMVNGGPFIVPDELAA